MKILYTSKFVRQYKKLPKSIKEKAKNKEKIFKEDVSDPWLETHKLKGRFVGYWSFSINSKNRIMFRFSKKSQNTVYFCYIGDHSIYE